MLKGVHLLSVRLWRMTIWHVGLAPDETVRMMLDTLL